MARKNKTLIVKVGALKTRGSWNGVKPVTLVHTPKTVYRRKGRRVFVED